MPNLFGHLTSLYFSAVRLEFHCIETTVSTHRNSSLYTLILEYLHMDTILRLRHCAPSRPKIKPFCSEKCCACIHESLETSFSSVMSLFCTRLCTQPIHHMYARILVHACTARTTCVQSLLAIYVQKSLCDKKSLTEIGMFSFFLLIFAH